MAGLDSLYAQDPERDLERRYFGRSVELKTDIPHVRRAAILEAGRVDISPIAAATRQQGGFSAAGNKYVIGAIEVRAYEVEFTIYTFKGLPTPGFNPGRSIDWDGKRTIQSRGRTVALPVASIILKYDVLSDLSVDNVNRALDPLVRFDVRLQNAVRRTVKP
jgi:hypothetical protein